MNSIEANLQNKKVQPTQTRVILIPRIYILIFLISFFLYFGLSLVLIKRYHFIYGESLAQTSIAMFAVISAKPDYGHIATISPPIDILLRIPLTALSMGLFSTPILAGNLFTALATSSSLTILYRIFKSYKLKQIYSILFLFLYGLNPLVIFFAVNGSSDSLLVLLIMLTFYFLIRWIDSQADKYLGLCGVVLACSILTSYYLIIISFLFVLFFLFAFRKLEIGHVFEKMILLVTPLFYALFFLLFINFIVNQNPFAFLSTPYTKLRLYNHPINPVFTLSENLYSISGNQFLLELGLGILILFPIILPIFAYYSFQSRKIKPLFAFLPILAIIYVIFDLRVLIGTIAGGYLAIIFPLIPLSFIFVVQISNQTSKSYPKKLYFSALTILFIISNLVSCMSLSNVLTDNNINQLLESIRSGEYINTFSEEKMISSYLANDLPNIEGKILINSTNGFPITLFTREPKRFLTNYEMNYEKIIENPTEYADYILLQDPQNYGMNDPINKYYPLFYKDSSSIVELVRDFDGETNWKLFRTVKK